MKVFFTIHNSHELSFDAKATEQAVSQRLEAVLTHENIKAWLGEIDLVETDVWAWIEDISGFAEHPYLEISHQQEKYHCGEVNCAVSWSSVYIDRHHELFHTKKQQLADMIMAALMYMLKDHALAAGQTDVADWLSDEFLDEQGLAFIAELKAGEAVMAAEQADQPPVLVLEFKTQGDIAPNAEDQQHHAMLIEYLDDFLETQGIGYVDGHQIGGGSMEIFCAVTDFDRDQAKVLQYLRNHKALLTPVGSYQE